MKQIVRGTLAGAAIVALLMAMGFPSAMATNSHSIDLTASSSQFLYRSDASQVGLDLTTDFTIEAWVKPRSQPGTNDHYSIVTKYEETGSSRNYVFSYDDIGGTKKLTLTVNPTGQAGGNVRLDSSAQTLSNGTWYHVAVVYSLSGGQAQFFVGGASAGSASGGPTSLTNGGAEFRIGQQVSGNNFWDGNIDEVRVWNVRRTAAEIANNYNRELSGLEADLQGYWRLNDDSAVDRSVNGNDLSTSGGPSYSTDKPTFVSPVKVRKAADQSRVSSTTLRGDNELEVELASNSTYIVDGVIMASSTSATPDIKIAFVAPAGATVALGYTAGASASFGGAEVLKTGGTSGEIAVPSTGAAVIQVKGTIKVGATAGFLTLKWAQNTSDSASTTVLEGSYLRADQL